MMPSVNDILNLNFANKNILIIGCPASGKTWLCNQFKTEHKKIHTDDYLDFGYEQSMYEVLEVLKKTDQKTIVEGVQGYRLLRKGVQLDCYYPDIVIEMVISESQMIRIYKKERQDKNIKCLSGFNKTHAKILGDYLRLPNNHKPEWIRVINEH